MAGWQCNCTTCYLSNKSSWTTRADRIITVPAMFILPSETQTIESVAMCHLYILYDTMIQDFWPHKGSIKGRALGLGFRVGGLGFGISL